MTRIQLGGRLHATEDAKAMGEASTEQRAKSMKATASASFSSSFAQVSASVSVGTSEAKGASQNHSSLARSLTWEAKGGDTLLCNK